MDAGIVCVCPHDVAKWVSLWWGWGLCVCVGGGEGGWFWWGAGYEARECLCGVWEGRGRVAGCGGPCWARVHVGAPVQTVTGPRFPWELHRACSARVPDDWIVGILQYEWMRRSDPDPPSRRLLSAAAQPNNVYRVYEHGGNMFMVYEVCVHRAVLCNGSMCSV
jgi:hypothetical protein